MKTENVTIFAVTNSPRFPLNSALRVGLFFIVMKVPFTKQIQTFKDQIAILKQRGMSFGNENEAEAWLKHVSYYRMSGYWYPLLADRANHIFKSGTTFEQAKILYEFDNRLRQLIMRYIGHN